MSDLDGIDAFKEVLDRLEAATSECNRQQDKVFAAECDARRYLSQIDTATKEIVRLDAENRRLRAVINDRTPGTERAPLVRQWNEAMPASEYANVEPLPGEPPPATEPSPTTGRLIDDIPF